jgi:hypothetical protein
MKDRFKGRFQLVIGGEMIEVDGELVDTRDPKISVPPGGLKLDQVIHAGTEIKGTGTWTQLGQLICLLASFRIVPQVENLLSQQDPAAMARYCPVGTACWVKLEATHASYPGTEDKKELLGYAGLFGRAFFSKDGRFLGLGLYE